MFQVSNLAGILEKMFPDEKMGNSKVQPINEQQSINEQQPINEQQLINEQSAYSENVRNVQTDLFNDKSFHPDRTFALQEAMNTGGSEYGGMDSDDVSELELEFILDHKFENTGAGTNSVPGGGIRVEFIPNEPLIDSTASGPGVDYIDTGAGFAADFWPKVNPVLARRFGFGASDLYRDPSLEREEIQPDPSQEREAVQPDPSLERGEKVPDPSLRDGRNLSEEGRRRSETNSSSEGLRISESHLSEAQKVPETHLSEGQRIPETYKIDPTRIVPKKHVISILDFS